MIETCLPLNGQLIPAGRQENNSGSQKFLPVESSPSTSYPPSEHLHLLSKKTANSWKGQKRRDSPLMWLVHLCWFTISKYPDLSIRSQNRLGPPESRQYLSSGRECYSTNPSHKMYFLEDFTRLIYQMVHNQICLQATNWRHIISKTVVLRTRTSMSLRSCRNCFSSRYASFFGSKPAISSILNSISISNCHPWTTPFDKLTIQLRISQTHAWRFHN